MNETPTKRGRGRAPGFVMTEEHKRKIGDANRGRRRSYAQKKRIAAGMRRYWAEHSRDVLELAACSRSTEADAQ